MSDGFVEIIISGLLFATSELIECFRMETCFKSDIDGIVDNDHGEYECDREYIGEYPVLNSEGCGDTRNKSRVNARHPSGTQSLSEGEFFRVNSVKSFENNPNNPSTYRNEYDVLSEKVHSYSG